MKPHFFEPGDKVMLKDVGLARSSRNTLRRERALPLAPGEIGSVTAVHAGDHHYLRVNRDSTWWHDSMFVPAEKLESK